MPFGKKATSTGRVLDFDAIYELLIAPAAREAGLAPIRADEERAGGIIHKPMFERLVLCEYAVADLTSANANVFYELGVRHAVRPSSTLLVYAEGLGQLPFDVGLLRALPYRMGDDGKPLDSAATGTRMTQLLREARKGAVDSPLFNLLEGYPAIAHEKTDVFRDYVEYSQALKQKLRTLRAIKPLGAAAQALREIEASLGAIADVESGVLVDLFLSYREVEAWQDMIGLAGRMPRALAATVLVREQHALALNRAGRGDEAEQVLLELIRTRGPSSETYGILGRVYKDRFMAAARSGSKSLAGGFLKKAVDAYLKGFESDFRDAYPGINALTLMAIADPSDPRLRELVGVVGYAVQRHMAGREPNYWDFATQLELALHGGNEAAAREAVSNALAAAPKAWEIDSTLNNLRLLWRARAEAGLRQPWEEEIESDLQSRMEELRGTQREGASR
jgi:hypothetical protein